MTLAEPQYVPDEDVYTRFTQQVEQHPESTAVLDRNGATSYGQLAERALHIAESLVAHGLAAETPVGVLMLRTADLVATLLGIWQAGGCYVPLEPDDPPQRTRHILDQAGCALVLGTEALLSTLGATKDPASSPAPILLDVDTLVATRPPTPPPLAPPDGRRLAYVLFTSGSTGMPKGVEVEHRSVVNLLCAVRDLLRFTAADRYLAVATIGFDISVAELFLPLTTGGTVVLRDRELLLDPLGLAREIRQHGVTVFQTGPSVWSVLLDEVPEFPRLRIAISTGEALPPALARRLRSVGDDVWNLYGPTETTVWATGHRLTADADAASGLFAGSTISAPIGRPLANVEICVLDAQRRPVLAGTRGELWIGGVVLARGYRHNPELTRARFVRLEATARTFYRTGDIVAQDAQGEVHYFGRNDDQIKVRGLRVEPMEVESAILQHPGIQQAAATWFETPAGSRAIVAAVVARAGSVESSQQLHEFLSERLPAAMIPSRYVFCAELPRAPSGKVDRNEIRARAWQTAEPAPDPADPDFTDTERTLAQIWQRTLGVAPGSRQDHFFTIGGDSLSAVSMALEVESTFKISITVRTVFEVAELGPLAEHIDRACGKSVRSRRPAILRVPRVKRLLERPDRRAADRPAFILPLSPLRGTRPVFFNSVDLKLARQGLWRADCTLYAVSPWAQGSGFLEARSLEALARSHIESIRTLQPHGPYRLAGYAFGGLIALETAQQLRNAGEEIALLFLLNPSEPGGSARATEPVRARRSAGDANQAPVAGVTGAMRWSMGLLSLPGSPIAAALRASKILAVWEWLCYRLAHRHGSHADPVSAHLLPRKRWPAFWSAARRLGRSYVPRPFAGNVLAVFADSRDYSERWKLLLGPAAEIRIIESISAGAFSERALAQWLEVLHARLQDSH